MNELLIGVDWSQHHYDISILAANGAVLTDFRLAKSRMGFRQLGEKIDKFGVPAANCRIGLETAHNILIDFLWSQQYQVYVVPPSVVNSSRGRLVNSGAYTDRADARLIAELLRTDRHRFAPWRPDSALLTTLKAKLNLVDCLTKLITQQTNRLRAVLQRVYLQALNAFRTLNKPIALHFLATYPTPQAAQELTYEAFAAFCRAHRCYNTAWIIDWYSNLHRPVPQADEALVAAYAAEIDFLARLSLIPVHEKRQLLRQIQELFGQHPDQALFASLPGAGDLLQPKLLVMFGEDRDRFPAPQDIRALAGTCPVTKQSGKKRRVLFRRACNRDYRHTAQQFAVASVKQADWAAAYYASLRARGHAKNHAYRCLANRWLGIIWKMWQTHSPYDEAYHLRQIHQHRRPTPAV